MASPLTTFSTCVRLLSCVNGDMGIQAAAVGKAQAALFAFVRLETTVASEVGLKSALLGETLFTDFTDKWPFTGVHSSMVGQGHL